MGEFRGLFIYNEDPALNILLDDTIINYLFFRSAELGFPVIFR